MLQQVFAVICEEDLHQRYAGGAVGAFPDTVHQVRFFFCAGTGFDLFQIAVM